jgi:hypothetical protein
MLPSFTEENSSAVGTAFLPSDSLNERRETMNRKFVAVGFNPQRTNAVSTALCVLIAKTCILLFFVVSASKSLSLLITANAADTNRIQREFLFNNCILSQEYSSASKQSRQKTNFFKQKERLTRNRPFQHCSLSLRSGGGVQSLRAAERRVGVWGFLLCQIEEKDFAFACANGEA